MPIDLNEFTNIFVEESLEMLQETEKILLNDENAQNDQENINHLFRYMHSIKGSSAIFKLTAMTELTHTLETFLDQARSGKRTINANDKENMLKVVDCLQTMIMNIKNNLPIDDKRASELTALFKQSSLEINVEKTDKPKNEKYKTWEIQLHPNTHIFQNAIEPLLLMQLLSEMGKIKVEIDTAHLPSLTECNPVECYLNWTITLYANVTSDDIQEIFNWVVDEKEVSIKPILIPQEKIKETFRRENDQTQMQLANTSVRVSTDKIDNLMNIVGELIVNQSILTKTAAHFDSNTQDNFIEGLASLEKTSRELQESALRIRMIPVSAIFTRFPRMIHDLNKQMHKETELIIAGEKTEIDKNMMEKLNDPLVHLIRNALAHGIELPDEREKKGKPRVGIVQLNAYQEGSNIIIDVADDGRGLDKEKIRAKGIKAGLIPENEEVSEDKIYQLIFQPGFSTNESVSDISGRGVGLDVVYKNISELGGDIGIETTKDIGTSFKLRLPLTLVILDAQLVKVSMQTYIIPLVSIVEIIKFNILEANELDINASLYHFRNEYIPLISLASVLGVESVGELQHKSLIIVSSMNGEMAALVVDELLAQQQVIIKNVEENYKKIPGVAGVTILGDGSVVLILDIKTIIHFNHLSKINNTIVDLNSPDADNTSIEPIENKTAEESQILIFEIDGHEYGIDIKVVKEIRMWETATAIPNAPSYIKGLINIRGMIIPIIDLNERFKLKSEIITNKSVIISLMIQAQAKTRYIGVIADNVLDTYPLHPQDIKSLPDNYHSKMRKYITGIVSIENKMVALLNPQHLVFVSVEQEKVL